jgi:hypothetical protein
MVLRLLLPCFLLLAPMSHASPFDFCKERLLAFAPLRWLQEWRVNSKLSAVATLLRRAEYECGRDNRQEGLQLLRSAFKSLESLHVESSNSNWALQAYEAAKLALIFSYYPPREETQYFGALLIRYYYSQNFRYFSEHIPHALDKPQSKLLPQQRTFLARKALVRDRGPQRISRLLKDWQDEQAETAELGLPRWRPQSELEESLRLIIITKMPVGWTVAASSLLPEEIAP